MRRFAQSAGYVRMRAITGSMFVVLGVTIIVRTLMVVALDLRAVAPLVMGAALVALGLLRFRDYLALRRRGA